MDDNRVVIRWLQDGNAVAVHHFSRVEANASEFAIFHVVGLIGLVIAHVLNAALFDLVNGEPSRVAGLVTL